MKYVKLFEEFINEDLLGTMGKDPYGDDIEIYINPKSVKRMMAEIRGLSDAKGNFYVITDGYVKTHVDIGHWLMKKGYIKHDGYMMYEHPDKYVTWQRKGSTNEFWLGESTQWGLDKLPDSEEGRKELDKLIKKVQKKNKQFKFIGKMIGQA